MVTDISIDETTTPKRVQCLVENRVLMYRKSQTMQGRETMRLDSIHN